MNKLLPAALLALAVSGLSAASSFAGTFGVFIHRGCSCCGGCGCNVCIRPYNAFSPVCCGAMYLDGSGPYCNKMGGPGCGAGCGPGLGGPGGCGSCGNACGGKIQYYGQPFCGCCDAAPTTLPDACPPSPCEPGPANPGVGLPPTGEPPAANPLVGPTAPPRAMPPGPSSMTADYQAIQSAAYQAYYPGYNYAPALPAAQPLPMAAPAYWGR